jgi:hypothetical protein
MFFNPPGSRIANRYEAIFHPLLDGQERAQ